MAVSPESSMRPSNDEIGFNRYNLEWLIENQVLMLTGDLEFIDWFFSDAQIPLEEWNAISPNLVSDDSSLSVQRDKRRDRVDFVQSIQWIAGTPSNVNGQIAPFRLEVAPRIQFFAHITLDPSKGAQGVLEGEYYSSSDEYTYYDFGDEEFTRWQGSNEWGLNWLDVGMVEGDYIQWDGTHFDVTHYGSLIYRSTSIQELINFIIPLGASNLEQTEAQAQEQGRMDDPLTPEDEFVPRPSGYNRARLDEIRRQIRFQNRGGRRMIGSILLLGIGIGLLYFFTKSRIVKQASDMVLDSAEGVVDVG